MTNHDADRAASIQWARDLLARDDWCILDSETTGIGPDAEIIQLGILGCDGQVILDTLVKPRCSIPAEATAIHGITDAHVRYAPRWPMLALLVDFILSLNKTTVIYNRDYDTRLIAQTARGYSLKPPEYEAVCAMKQYSAFVGSVSAYGDYKWQKLPALDKNAHNAIADARSTLALIRMMAETPDGAL